MGAFMLPTDTIRVQEFAASTPTRVDTEKGIIYGVKFLGEISSHGREYPFEMRQRALKLFENRPSYANHPAKPGDSRDVRTLIGWTKNPENRADGVYGEWHYLKNDPLGAKVAEAAERNPSVLGFSQVADVKQRLVGSRKVVESIDFVDSVDLVAEGATTKGIFESKDPPMQKTFKQFLSSLFASDTTKIRVLEADPPADVMAANMPADAVPTDTGGTSEDQAKAAFKAMVVAVWDDQSLSWPETLKKIKDIATTQEKLLESGSTATTTDTTNAPAPTDAAATATEGRVRALERRLMIRELCDAENVKPTLLLTKAMEGARDEAEMRVLIAEAKKTTTPETPGKKPQSAGTRVAESKASAGFNADAINDGKALAAACFG